MAGCRRDRQGPERAQTRYLRAVQARSSPRDRALALIPFYAGARISETVALDLDDVRLSARKGVLRILGKGERVREVPTTTSSARPSRTGRTNARTGPEPIRARRCSSTSEAGA
jgi:site-specific recombinase XerD